METKAILFDLGDTLFDLTNYTCVARRIMLEKLIDQGTQISNPGQAEKIFKNVIEEHAKPHADRLFLNDFFLTKFFEELGIKTKTNFPRIALIIYRDIIKSLITPSPLVIQTLAALKARGYKLGIITDGSINTTYEILMRLAITTFFDTIVVSEEVGTEKPNSRIFKEAAERLNVKTTETMIVGDNLERDIKGGKKAGMTTVLMERHRLSERSRIKPDFKIQIITEVLDLPPVRN